MGSSIKKNLFYNITLKVLDVLFPLLTAPYVARVLGAEGVGVIGFTTTYASYFTLFAALGIPIYGIREIAKCRNNYQESKNLISEIFSIHLFSVLLFILIYFFTIYQIPQLDEQKNFLLISGFSLYLSPFSIEWFFSGREEFKFITIRSLVVKIVAVVGLFVFVKTKEDTINYIILLVFSNIVNQIWNYTVLCKLSLLPNITFKNLKRHLRPLLYFYASAIAISIYTMLDTIMLGFISIYEEVGYYTSATKVSKLFLPIVASLTAVTMPRLVFFAKEKKHDEMQKLINQSFSLVSFLAFPLVVALIMIAPVFVPLFLGEDFEGAILPLQIMAVVILVIGFNNLIGVQILAGMGYENVLFRSVLVGSCSNFILNLILIPFYGAIGASIASVVAETLILFVMIDFVYKKTTLRFEHLFDSVKNIGLSLFFIPLFYILHQYLQGWWLLITFTLFGSLYYLLSQWMLNNPVMNVLAEILKKELMKRM